MMKQNYNIALTKAAMEQIHLMKEFDYTIENCHLRISINGKECDGFRYATGFTLPRPDDVVLSYPGEGIDTHLLLDPFIAQYFWEGEIDYQQSEVEEGFVINNFQETNYHGKFFAESLKSEDLT
ncbi:MAG: hypothetical protein QE271_04295 [Bacteriovoracaceae bacterium]|nr:hypothetical protein [Bacteriovoracaceae bacterium]